MRNPSDLQNMRRSYELGELNESSFPNDPIEAFSQWFAIAREHVPFEANAMSLATVNHQGNPSVRTVLLKGYDEKGFVFFTNYQSRKGRELGGHSYAAALFHWNPLERQIRIEGRVEKTTREETEAYFATRPRESQIGAWASPQSEVVRDREQLVQMEKAMEKKFEGKNIPPPDFWGGYRIIPERIEFWQGRKGRLHDRLLYEKSATGWHINRLAP